MCVVKTKACTIGFYSADKKENVLVTQREKKNLFLCSVHCSPM